ncbi:hypothetical protein BC828DRAFT_414760 [Blastocladiella britannica]|nr:hypothetical protein BC828DRAFT_414760 [Blastocladiella britannica]
MYHYHNTGKDDWAEDSDGDDVWGNDDIDDTTDTTVDPEAIRVQIYDREMARLKAKFHDAGYREGIIDGKDRTMQAGFDDGYQLGSAVGRRLGHLVGTLKGHMLFLAMTVANPETAAPLLDRGAVVLADLQSAAGSVTAVFPPTRAAALYAAATPEEAEKTSAETNDAELVVRDVLGSVEAQVADLVRDIKAAVAGQARSSSSTTTVTIATGSSRRGKVHRRPVNQ